MSTTASQLRAPLGELLDRAPLQTPGTVDLLLRYASESVQTDRAHTLSSFSDPRIQQAITDRSILQNPDNDTMVMLVAVGMAASSRIKESLQPGLTKEEAVTFTTLGAKVRSAVLKQWRDTQKHSGTKLYDSLRTLG